MIPTDSTARKNAPVYSGFMAYFPDAMVEVARLSKAGNDKHNPNQPLHWSRDKSSDHGDCILRHQLEFDKVDPEDGYYHAVKVAWRAMAQLQVLLEAADAEAKDGWHLDGDGFTVRDLSAWGSDRPLVGTYTVDINGVV